MCKVQSVIIATKRKAFCHCERRESNLRVNARPDEQDVAIQIDKKVSAVPIALLTWILTSRKTATLSLVAGFTRSG